METRYRVRGYDCGYGGPFRPLSLANFFQEAAGDHARVLGVGMEDMFANGRTWMLSRIDVRAEALPSAGDEVVVRTWPGGTDRLFALRYLEMRTPAGELLAGARYEYLIVDMERRKPLRPQGILDPGLICSDPPPFPDLSPGLGRETAFELDPGAVTPGHGFTRSFDLSVRPRHIDYNGHVNNAYLAEWLCDACPRAGTSRLARLKVDFVAEAVEGDRIEGWHRAGAGAGNFLCLLSRGGDLVARAHIEWKS